MTNEKPENDINTMAEVDPEPENKTNEQGQEWAFVSTVSTGGGGGGGERVLSIEQCVRLCVCTVFTAYTDVSKMITYHGTAKMGISALVIKE